MASFLDFTGLDYFTDKIKAWAQGLFVPSSRKVNGKALSADVTLTAADVSAIPTSQKGTANGVATLDSTGKILSSQMPASVDEIMEYANRTSFPQTGEDRKIYVAEDTNLCYRWAGTTYVEISPSIALGETSSTAYRGDRGKTAYDHSQLTSGNPHNVTKTDVGLGNLTNDKQVKGLASGATNGHVVAFGTDGYTIKDTGFTIGVSVPANAKFTDTTYTNFKGAAASAAGAAGLVPAPSSGQTDRFLKSDGTWAEVATAEVESITTTEIDELFD